MDDGGGPSLVGVTGGFVSSFKSFTLVELEDAGSLESLAGSDELTTECQWC